VVRDRLNSRQQRFRLRFEDRNRVVRAREGLHRFQGIEEINDDELGFMAPVRSKHIPTSIAFQVFQPRQNLVLEKGLVSVGMLEFCPTSPMTCDHDAPFRQHTWPAGIASKRAV
jgi:hypothetical protein